jgi:catechol 2,3-dioxygenase-like lactoylglutathione lyase family enzyme
MATFKTHVALRVTDLDRSLAFYRAMLGAEPVKHKADYAKFELENPGLNLTLNLSPGVETKGALSHLGIQVESAAAVKAAIARFQTAGLATFEEHNTDCCYALQDKVWVTDPDGTRWEIFVVTVADTTPDQNLGPVAPMAPPPKAACCA